MIVNKIKFHILGENLRGLLNHPNQQQFNHMGNFGPTMGMDTRHMTPQQQQIMMNQLRNNYMNNQQPHFSGNGQQNGSQMTSGSTANAINQLQRFHPMQNNRPMMNTMRPPNLMPANMKTTSMRYPSGQQQQQSGMSGAA